MQHLGRTRSLLVLAACVGVAITVMAPLAAAARAGKTSHPWPQGMGVWKYMPEMTPWMQSIGVTWYQYWSGATGDQGKPYIFEIKTANYDYKTIKTWLKNRGPNCFGVNVDCEVPKTAKSKRVARMVCALAPGLKVFSGNMDWTLQPRNFWAWTDGIMCFYNCTRYNRCAGDVFYFIALAGYYRKPLCFSVQGQDGEGVPPASVAEFKQALTYASNCEGQIIWPGDRLARYNWTEVNGALRTYPHDAPRQPKLVRLSGDRRKDMALCRIVGYKGFRPVGSKTSGVTWNNITAPGDYFSNLTKFYDTGATKAMVVAQEQNMAVRW